MILAKQLDAFTEDPPTAVVPVRMPNAPYQETSHTSREAAKLIAGHLNNMHRNILRLAIACDRAEFRGITRKDVERGCAMKTPTACARLNALEHAGKLQKLYTVVYDREGQGSHKLITRESCGVYVVGPRAVESDWR